MEWGKERLVWLFLGHMSVSQVANLISRKVWSCASFPFQLLSPLLFVEKEP